MEISLLAKWAAGFDRRASGGLVDDLQSGHDD
jgi:hypothetical protein